MGQVGASALMYVRKPMGGWVVYACRTAYALEVAEAIWRRGEEVALFVDNLEDGAAHPAEGDELTETTGAPVRRPADLSPAELGLAAVIPLITPGHRLAVEAEARALGFSAFPPLVDPTAVIARTASVGEGAVVNAAAVIAAATEVGRFAHLNRGASVGHHNIVEEYATVGPGCVLAGHVRVGRGAFVGAGAVCAPEVAIGANAVVGAGAVVLGDVPARAVAVGNPARVIREDEPGYGGVSVPEAAR
jgi:sugar O-acyltransferase (sialic acid O-acetyltransferase NeuD family)